MVVKRIGNDVYLTWEINNKDGSPVDFSDIIDMKVYIRRAFFKQLHEQKFEVTGNVIKLHYIAEEQAGIGSYDLLAKWTKADPEVEGGIASFAVDYRNAFKLIGFGETVPDQQDETFSSNIYEAIKGDKGDSSYQTWLDAGNTGTEADYLAWIQQPATDIEQVVSSNETVRISSEETRQLNETARVEAETLRGSAETQRISDENTRKSNETGRINAESLRLSAEEERGAAEGLRASSETSRNTAEGLRAAEETARVNNESTRQSAEELRQTNTAEAIQSANTAAQQADTATTAATTAAGEATDAAGLANDAATAANTAAGLADTARLAIQDDLASKADQTELDQLAGEVEQLAYVKIKNEVVNGNFENGLIAPFYRTDGSGGASTLDINSSTPISGNYDVRFTITTPATGGGRPNLFGLNRAGNIGDKIYLHFYAKILSGTPIISGIHNGASVSSIYNGDVINGRNTRILDVGGTSNSGLIYFNSYSVWDMQMDNFMRINLTETFGAGNEPTEEEMNLLLDMLPVDYFEGEITIPAQKIMQWQLKLIRKNKNAIIALGGTII